MLGELLLWNNHFNLLQVTLSRASVSNSFNLLHEEKSSNSNNQLKMESKIVLILAIIAHTTLTTNSMPTRNVQNLDTSISPLEISTPDPEKKILADHTGLSVNPEMKKIAELAPMEKRSIEKDEKNVNLDGEKKANLHGEKKTNLDDLETAAGTNILRPLFVYRQQLAYRERVRKAGRRAVPNF